MRESQDARAGGKLVHDSFVLDVLVATAPAGRRFFVLGVRGVVLVPLGHELLFVVFLLRDPVVQPVGVVLFSANAGVKSILILVIG